MPLTIHRVALGLPPCPKLLLLFSCCPNPRPVPLAIFLLVSPEELPNNETTALSALAKALIPSGLLPFPLACLSLSSHPNPNSVSPGPQKSILPKPGSGGAASHSLQNCIQTLWPDILVLPQRLTIRARAPCTCPGLQQQEQSGSCTDPVGLCFWTLSSCGEYPSPSALLFASLLLILPVMDPSLATLKFSPSLGSQHFVCPSSLASLALWARSTCLINTHRRHTVSPRIISCHPHNNLGRSPRASRPPGGKGQNRDPTSGSLTPPHHMPWSLG